MLTDVEKNFHKQRIAFVILDGKVYYLPNNEKSHEEWLVESQIVSRDKFNQVTRGFVKDGNIYFYKGDFETSLEVEDDAIAYTPTISDVLGILVPSVVYCGMNKGKIGEVWKPINEIRII